MVSVPLNALTMNMSSGEGAVDQEYKVNDDSFVHVYGVNWYAQTFTPAITQQVTKVYLKLEKEGSPGLVTASIRATTAGKPSGSDLTSGTRDLDTLNPLSGGSWYDFDFGTGTALTASTVYAIVVRSAGADTDNDAQWRVDITSPAYSGGSIVTSGDSGSTWNAPDTTVDTMFKEALG